MAQTATQKIAEFIKAAIADAPETWTKPYIGGISDCVNFTTGNPYRGSNRIIGRIAHPNMPAYATFKQAKAAGCEPAGSLKGKGIPMLKFGFVHIANGRKVSAEVWNASADQNKYTRTYVNYFHVFHISLWKGDAVDAFLESISSTEERELPEPIHIAEELIKEKEHLLCQIETVSNQIPCYMPGRDKIKMPPVEEFIHSVSFYGTLFHEIGHASGHESRLNRFSKDTKLQYATEELVAESFSCIILQELGILNQFETDNSKAYIKLWADRIKGKTDDEIVKSIHYAAKAVEWFLNN